MSDETPDVDPILTAIEARAAAWQAVAERYRAARALESGQLVGIDVSAVLTQSGGPPRAASSAPVDLPTGAFRSMGMAPSIRFYLAAAKGKRTMKQIAAALKEGGLVTTTESRDKFEKSLNTTLYRLRNEGVLLRFSDGWDLAEPYPEQFRQRLANKDAKPTKSSAARKRKRGRGKPKGRAKRSASASVLKVAPR